MAPDYDRFYLLYYKGFDCYEYNNMVVADFEITGRQTLL